MNFTIIKNAPPPPAEERGNRARKSHYPFRDMEVGDAFDAPCDLGAHMFGPDKRYRKDKRQHQIVNASRHVTKATGAQFTTRVIDDGKTVRCWRTA